MSDIPCMGKIRTTAIEADEELIVPIRKSTIVDEKVVKAIEVVEVVDTEVLIPPTTYSTIGQQLTHDRYR